MTKRIVIVGSGFAGMWAALSAASDFELKVPDGPGLGIEIDEERLSFFARDGLRKKISIGG